MSELGLFKLAQPLHEWVKNLRFLLGIDESDCGFVVYGPMQRFNAATICDLENRLLSVAAINAGNAETPKDLSCCSTA